MRWMEESKVTGDWGDTAMQSGFRGVQVGFNPAAAPLGHGAAGQEVSGAGAGSAGAQVPTCHPWECGPRWGAWAQLHAWQLYIYI